MPMQFGPMMRSNRAAPIQHRLFELGVNPAVMTTTARVPLPKVPIKAGTVSGLVAITASSGASGSAAISGKQRRPPIASWFGLTKVDLAFETAVKHILGENVPTEPASVFAPITAIERGAKNTLEITNRHRSLRADGLGDA